MKKYIKSILALWAAALLGSSAQAVQTKTVMVGETTSPLFKYSPNKGGRWWCLVGNDGKACVDPIMYDKNGGSPSHHESNVLLSADATGSDAYFCFKGLTVGTSQWRIARTSASGGKVPINIDQLAFSGSGTVRPYEGDTQNQWVVDTADGNTYEVVVNDLPQTPDGLTAGPVDSGTKLSAISTSSIQGKIVDSNGTTVQGSLAWQNGETEVAVGENTYKVTFTPTGTLAQYFGNPTNFNVTIVGNAPWKLVENPVIVKATRVTFSDNQTKTETQYDGFLTEKGGQYAWGKDGSPTTAWTEPSDGTPCDISAKPGDATQLFMKGPAK